MLKNAGICPSSQMAGTVIPTHRISVSHISFWEIEALAVGDRSYPP